MNDTPSLLISPLLAQAAPVAPTPQNAPNVFVRMWGNLSDAVQGWLSTWLGAPLALWLLLLMLPLILLYFLKLRRPRREVPSLALWQQVMADQRVNSPFQRFRRNLLLWLQLLVLTCLVFAAAQPFWPSGAERADYLPIIIDNSASMAARDKAGGQTRFEVARDRVTQLIDNLAPHQRISLITMSNTGRRLTDFTSNKRLLKEALATLTIQDVPSRLDEALRLAQALSRTYSFNKVLLLTDGNLPESVDFELPYDLTLELLDPAGPNLAITELNARRSRDRWDLFVRLEAAPTTEGSAVLEFRRGDEKLGEETVSLAAGEARRILFPIETTTSQRIDVRLLPQQFDSLEADNAASIELPVMRSVYVYVSPALNSFRQALSTIPGVQLFPAETGTATDAGAEYDLVIGSDSLDKLPGGQVTLLIGQVPTELNSLLMMETDLTRVIDWQRNSSLLLHVQLGEVQLSDKPVLAKSVQDRDFEQRGYEILAQSATGPLILRKEDRGRQQFWFLFHTDRSTLPYRVAFPVLAANAVEYARFISGLSEIHGVKTGALPPRQAEPEQAFQIKSPTGHIQNVVATSQGLLNGIAAPQVGEYVISQGGKEVDRVTAGLLSASESSLNRIEQIHFREISVSASQEKLQTDRPLWAYIAWLGLIILAIEWWFYQRRPGGWHQTALQSLRNTRSQPHDPADGPAPVASPTT